MIDFLKKIWAWVVRIPQDKLLHDYATALIALFSFVLAFVFFRYWPSFWIANGLAAAFAIGKEVYDYFHPEGHSVEWKDLAFDLFGLVKIDLALLILLIGL